MGNACSSDFLKSDSNESVGSFQFWQNTFKARTVLGKGYNSAWPISLAVLCLIIADWSCRTAAARVRKDARNPLKPLFFNFVGHGNSIRQLCVGLYGFLWVCLFVIMSKPSGADSSDPASRTRLAPDIPRSIGLFFQAIPWTAAAGLFGISAFSCRTLQVSIVALPCIAVQVSLLLAPLFCKYNSSIYGQNGVNVGGAPRSASASWMAVRSFFDGLHLIPLIFYCLVLIVCSLMLTIHDVCVIFHRARAIPFFSAVCSFVAKHSLIFSSTEHVKSMLKLKVVSQPAASPFRITAALDFLKRLHLRRLPRMPVVCVILCCISLQLGLAVLSFFTVSPGDIVIGSIIPLLRTMQGSLSQLPPSVIDFVAALLLTLFTLTVSIIAYFAVSLPFRMRKSFMLALDDLGAHLSPFPEGIREACSYRYACFFIPMFAANTAVSLFILSLMCIAVTFLITFAMILTGSCIALRTIFPKGLPMPAGARGSLPAIVADLVYSHMCPALEPFMYQTANEFITSSVVFLVFALIMRPNYFQLFRTLANNTPDPCFAPTMDADRGRRRKLSGKLTVVEPSAAGLLAVFTMVFTLFESVIGAVANGLKLLVLFPTTLPYLNICSDPLAPNVGCAMCLHLFSHLCFRHIQLFCLLVTCSYMAFCSSVLLEHETGSPVFSKAVAQFCSTILRRPVVLSSSFSEDFRRDFYDGLQLSEIEFCKPASAQALHKIEMEDVSLAESSDAVREIQLSSIRARARWRLILVLHANPSLRSMRKKVLRPSQVLDDIDKSEDMYTRSRAVSTFRRRMSTAADAPQLVVITEKSTLLGGA